MTLDDEIVAAEAKLIELRERKAHEEETPGQLLCECIRAEIGTPRWELQPSSHQAWERAAQAVLERFGKREDPSRSVTVGDVWSDEDGQRWVVLGIHQDDTLSVRAGYSSSRGPCYQHLEDVKAKRVPR